MKMKVFVTDDHDAVVEGFKVLIKSYGFEMVGFSKTGQGLINWLNVNTCDIVILDLSLPDMSGIEVLKKLSGKEIPKFIVVSGTSDKELIKQSIILGAKGFVCKDEVHLVLRESLEKIYRGRKYFSHSVMDTLISKQLEEEKIVTMESILSPKEVQTLRLMMNDFQAHQICEEMNITKGTLGKVYQRIRNKLDVKKNIGFIILAIKHKFKQ